MPTKKSETLQEIYQLKVTLLGTAPPIWRRLLVPADLTLAQLHDVLQVTMGWENSHMHEFLIDQQRYGTPDPDDRLMGIVDRSGLGAVGRGEVGAEGDVGRGRDGRLD